MLQWRIRENGVSWADCWRNKGSRVENSNHTQLFFNSGTEKLAKQTKQNKKPQCKALFFLKILLTSHSPHLCLDLCQPMLQLCVQLSLFHQSSPPICAVLISPVWAHPSNYGQPTRTLKENWTSSTRHQLPIALQFRNGAYNFLFHALTGLTWCRSYETLFLGDINKCLPTPEGNQQ